MGGIFSCFHELSSSPKPAADEERKSGGKQDAAVAAAAAAVAAVIASEKKWEKGQSARAVEDALIQEAATLILLQQQQQRRRRRQNGGGRTEIPLERSASLRNPGILGERKPQGMRRSSSSRLRSVADAVVPPEHLLNQEIKIDDIETNHFVLVHGGGFGAWCWYKTIALLEDTGFKVNAIDLTGSGVHSFDTSNITSLTQYAKPLTNFLEKLDETHKVILVGHDFGGACISHAMEAFPRKIAKAVFVAAAMLKDGQSTLDMFSQQEGASNLMRQAQIFLYENGKDNPPTFIDFDKSLLKELLFNQSPVKDITLASVSMRPIPFAPVLQKLLLTDSNYGSVRRFYVETTDDNVTSPALQQSMCESNRPEIVFRLKGSDHSPFFSKPQALHKLLVEIALIPANQPRDQ